MLVLAGYSCWLLNLWKDLTRFVDTCGMDCVARSLDCTIILWCDFGQLAVIGLQCTRSKMMMMTLSSVYLICGTLLLYWLVYSLLLEEHRTCWFMEWNGLGCSKEWWWYPTDTHWNWKCKFQQEWHENVWKGTLRYSFQLTTISQSFIKCICMLWVHLLLLEKAPS